MQLQLFTEQLSNLATNRDNQLNCSETRRRLSNSAHYKITQLLNLAVFSLAQDEYYCQIGCDHSAYLIGALLNNDSKIAYFVDDLNNENLEQLEEQISNYDLEEQILFCQQNYQEFFFDLQKLEPETKIGVYFYNSSSDYRSVFLALLLVKPFLSEEALIIVNNSNYSAVQQAIADFLITTPQCQTLFKISSPLENNNSYQQIQVITKNYGNINNDNFSDFTANNSHQYFLQSLYQFCKDFEYITKNNQLNALLEKAGNLGKEGNLEELKKQEQAILAWDSNNPYLWCNLAIKYDQLGEYKQAIKCFSESIKNDFASAIYYYYIGAILEKINQWDQAIQAYQKAIQIDCYCVNAYINLSNIYLNQRKLEKAELYLEECIKYNPDKKEPCFNLLLTLSKSGKTEKLIQLATDFNNLFPQEIVFQFKQYLTVPIFYENHAQIKYYRGRFRQGIEIIENKIEKILEQPLGKIKALEALEKHNNFYLAYQNSNDLELQKRYGDIVTKIMRINYPQWSEDIPLRNISTNQKIRIGFVCSGSRNRANWFLGWLENLNPEKFELYCYGIEDIPLDLIEQLKLVSHQVYSLPYNLEAVCQQIRKDQLDILTYTDIGMNPQTIQMGALRLASRQCVTLGHPITSGLSAIDYYISRELMEADNAQQHYSEKLILLPNIGVCLKKPNIPNQIKQRSDFSLENNDVVYLSSQSIFKYLPQYDYIFPAIASKVNNAKFVFIELYKSLTAKFKYRLEKVFREYDLNLDTYCLFLPRLTEDDYLQLNLVADIFLDTFGWSGDNTTRTAIACSLPLVTCPGEFMRGRHSLGMLKMIGVEDTIAEDQQEYLAMAVRLGLDRQWRQSIIEKLKANSDRLYNDLTCVKALEKFYQQIVANSPQII